MGTGKTKAEKRPALALVLKASRGVKPVTGEWPDFIDEYLSLLSRRAKGVKQTTVATPVCDLITFQCSQGKPRG